jgi:hypothetical protein
MVIGWLYRATFQALTASLGKATFAQHPMERLAGPALPFTSEESVVCQALDAPEGAKAVSFVIGAVPFRQGGALWLPSVVEELRAVCTRVMT